MSTIIKTDAIIKWTKIKKILDSNVNVGFIIKKLGEDYILYTENNYSPQIKL